MAWHLLLWSWGLPGYALADGAPKDPALVKSAFLCNFAKFTEWPTSAFATLQSPIVIGILGADPLGSLLDRTAKAVQIQGRELTIRRFASSPGPGECHVLFIPANETRRMDEWLTALGNNPVLTVGDDPGFADRGGMIGILEKDGGLRFQVNLAAASGAGLRFSAGMLKLAEKVIRTPGTPKR